ncbi:PTS sugar transporter subunit IIA [Brachybacterium sp. EF45031]|uniref:PTS sugar transporter subunit IIA n=1 Tax=Brachybacterium sillae TaxID=2810536 RepID=UPI00217F1F73|nr:PTS sugar transporter subunit IIA [Brachybacterium sillae]MCS6712526.1 PTS sugar transporter subunit IIA [Brachybacterium sillae]
MTTSQELLPSNAVRLDVQADDRNAAIRAAGDLLVATGAADDTYTQRMIDVVEQHGPYIVITPGVALAHARPDASVHRTGMSAVRLARPVRFGHETNDPVTLVLALAAADDTAHQQALAHLASLLADPQRRASLDSAGSADQLHRILSGALEDRSPHTARRSDAGHLLLTVCGNGLGTSLFLKSTLEQVLDRWGWTPHVRVEATDTISARGRSQEAAAILTSGEIARTLGRLDIPVEVVSDFTSTREVDAALRRIYDV